MKPAEELLIKEDESEEKFKHRKKAAAEALSLLKRSDEKEIFRNPEVRETISLIDATCVVERSFTPPLMIRQLAQLIHVRECKLSERNRPIWPMAKGKIRLKYFA